MSKTTENAVTAMADRLHHFLIMMYKGLLLRKRHYVVTAIEIIIPLIVASIAVIIAYNNSSYRPDDFPSEGSSHKKSPFYPPFSPFDDYYVWRKPIILYAPNNSNSDILLQKAWDIYIWNVHYHDSWPELQGYETEKELETAATTGKRENKYVIGTVFINFFNESKMPPSLDYKIRFQTASSFDLDTIYNPWFRPEQYLPYKGSLFLLWQASIEQAFISLKANKSEENDDYNITLQRMPYPPYQSELKVEVQIISLYIISGFVIFFCVMVKRVVAEKANHSKELLKMMGLTDSIYWSSTFFNYFLFGGVLIFIITILFKIPLNYNGVMVFNKAGFGAVLLILLLYLVSSILLYLVVTTVFNRPNLAVCVTLLLHVLSQALLMALVFEFNYEPKSKYLSLTPLQKYAICLVPNGAIQAAMLLFSAFETLRDDEIQTGIMNFSMHSDFTLTGVILMMLLSCFIYCLLIWYLDAAWPWKLGVPQPLYFPFTKSYWCNSVDEMVSEEDWKSNDEFFEQDPEGTKRGIAIRNLTKAFNTGAGSNKAVDNMSLNIYSDQITALLGRNGAGKTTTINILTGLFMPSSGTASVNGWDIRTHTKMARSSLGICPQHNVLYDTLTVEEHLRLYAALKGVKWGQLSQEVTNTLSILKLLDKRTELSRNLSGGMKRKLSLGIAIIGGSKVLFLDEPTSGMDPEARRSLWDILLGIRVGRTIVLTTHYMEEADILGDRIAIMADGRVQCCGSPMFLKRKFGTGYHLHIVKGANCNINSITSLIQNHFLQAVLESVEENPTLTYSFGDNTTGLTFGTLFQDLEFQKDNLGISSFGVTVTTMDDVFLKVSLLADEIASANIDTGSLACLVEPNEESPFPQYERLYSGTKLWMHQFKGLFLKRLIYARRYWTILICQLLIPFALTCVLLIVLQVQPSSIETVQKSLKLDLPSVYGKTVGFYDFASDTNKLEDVYKSLLSTNDVAATQVNDPNSYILNMANTNINNYKKKLLLGGGGNFSERSLNVTAWFNGEAFQVMPMTLNLMHVALLRYYTGDETVSMTLTNSPFPSSQLQFNAHDPFLVHTLTCIFIPLILAFVSACYVLVPINECQSRAKLLQLMTGVSTFTYWLSMFLWDMLTHIILILLLFIPFAIFAGFVFFQHPEAIGGVIALLLLFGWSMLPFCYLVSRVIEKPATGFIFILSFMTITGLVLGEILSALFLSNANKEKVEIAMYFLKILPSFAVSWGLSNLFSISYDNVFCERIPEGILNVTCQPSSTSYDHYNIKQCCKDLCGNNCFNKTYPFTLDSNGCGIDMIYLAMDGLIFFLLLIFLETGILSKVFSSSIDKLPLMRKKTQGGIILQDMLSINTGEDSDVTQEESRIASLGTFENEALIAKQLTKYYRGFCAVDALSFGVHKEECFGLLGVNGAGKTSTFKMLTGDIYPTTGDAMIMNTSICKDLKQFQSFIGYCPQFDALIDRLTGKEMLHLFASLKGISNIDDCVAKMIASVDLQDHANKQTRFYSGGNKRKLSIAMALLGSPPVILLDEPSSGVDPVSRRKIWHILNQTRKINKSAIILCTHSMEECEALCVRLAIMVNGKFCCLGSIQHLKSKYGLGFTVTIKVQREQSINNALMTEIRSYFESTFPGATLKDFHQGMFEFYINDASISWSRLFNSMEQMKQRYQFEDYLISGTTLEQIFLGFARRQRVAAI